VRRGGGVFVCLFLSVLQLEQLTQHICSCCHRDSKGTCRSGPCPRPCPRPRSRSRPRPCRGCCPLGARDGRGATRGSRFVLCMFYCYLTCLLHPSFFFVTSIHHSAYLPAEPAPVAVENQAQKNALEQVLSCHLFPTQPCLLS
jgi:hypothetical protein